MGEPFWSDDHLTLYGGDCREVLRELPAELVHCVVTSPPYWGLRDYGTASWDGGDPACDHKTPRVGGTAQAEEQRARADAKGYAPTSNFANYGERWTDGSVNKPVCGKCGARRIDSQLGLEATTEEFVANMVDVFREVRRVLRKDGTLWLNLGDSYAQGPSGTRGDTSGFRNGQTYARSIGGIAGDGLKPKDLVGIPWRVAFALQADGWYLRSDIIWAKPNPMPESVTDRPTKAHEYLFLLTRSPRYYYDAEAVREPFLESTMERSYTASKARDAAPKNKADPMSMQATGWTMPSAGRNLRTVWNIATEPYPGAHFATFPRKLVEPCVKAGTSERGVCPECGAPWVRETEREASWKGPRPNGELTERNVGGRTDGLTRPADHYTVNVRTTGWGAACDCMVDPVPAVVLDPFAGSGTTLFVAQALGRRGVGIDLSPDYLRQALERNRQTPLGLVG